MAKPTPLKNARHERFAQELAKGKSQLEAYRLAGYEPIESSASRLLTNAKVAARVEQLKARAAERAEITVADIARQLDEDREFARSCGQSAAAVSATLGKAKILGLVVDRQEVTGKNGGPIEIDQVNSDAADFSRRVLGLAARAQAGRGDGDTQH